MGATPVANPRGKPTKNAGVWQPQVPWTGTTAISVYNDRYLIVRGGVFPGKIVFPTVYRSEIWVLPVEI